MQMNEISGVSVACSRERRRRIIQFVAKPSGNKEPAVDRLCVDQFELGTHNKLAPSEFLLVSLAWDDEMRTVLRKVYRIMTSDNYVGDIEYYEHMWVYILPQTCLLTKE
jgi:hypothetical protein